MPRSNRPDFVMMPGKAAGFPRTARLLRHADFERVYKQGRRHFSASMTVFYWPRLQAEEKTGQARGLQNFAPEGMRVGFTVGRALGGAVQRNQMKRRLREAVRMARSATNLPADVVINPKKSLLTTDFADVLNEVTRIFTIIDQKLSHQTLETSGSSGNKVSGSRRPKNGSRS
jgi:ribonuclease P protein component